jgi:hypothetical protein
MKTLEKKTLLNGVVYALVLALVFSLALQLPVLAQQPDMETVEASEWVPFSEDKPIEDVFVLDPSDPSNMFGISGAFDLDRPVEDIIATTYMNVYPTYAALFSSLKIPYSGSGKKIVLGGGYTYSTGYNHNNISVNVYYKNQWTGLYYVQCAG